LRELLDEDGARIRHKTFKPFGGDYASVGTLQSWNVSYAGHRRHDDTGLYFMQARWMDPNAGTFLSIDPLVPNAYDPQTVNPFAYARNNPINWIDPDGQAACGPLGIACFGLNPSEIANWLGSGFSDLAAINLDFYAKELAYEKWKFLTVAKQSAAAEATRDAALEAEIANRTGQEAAQQSDHDPVRAEDIVNEARVVDYDSPDIYAPDPTRDRTGSDQIDVAKKFKAEVMAQSDYRRATGEYVTVARPSIGGWAYDRPRWFRGTLFRVEGIPVTSPEFTMHSHTPDGTRGPSDSDIRGSRETGAMGVVIHPAGDGSVYFYQETRGGDRLVPTRVD